MKFIIDNALSPQLAIGLFEFGYDAIHVRDLNMGISPDR
jgi:predicted nuclease of predicted toxin-antitoxin system